MEGRKGQRAPYELNMDPDEALRLVKHGASLLLLEVPPGTSVGIDCQMFVVGPNFKGVKMIPPGPHFVYYSASSRHGNECAPVIGFFIFTASSEVIVRQWDPQEERLVKLADNNEEERFAMGVKNFDFDRHLGPYDLHHYQEWKQHSSHITKNVIERLEPVGSEITVMSEAELIGKGAQTAAERCLMEQFANAEQRMASSRKVYSGSQRCFYTPIPRSVKHRGMTAAELTALNLDKPLHTRTPFFSKVLEVVYFQLKQGFQAKHNIQEKENTAFLDDSWLCDDCFLQLLFKDFFSLIRDVQPIDGELLYQAKRLKKVLETALGWRFNKDVNHGKENDEFAPVVVTEEVLSNEEMETNDLPLLE